MSGVGRAEVAELFAGIVSASPRERDEAAGHVFDLAEVFDEFEARLVVRVLSVAARFEDDAVVRESQLYALVEVVSHRAPVRDDVAPALEIPRSLLKLGAHEHIDDLLEILSWYEAEPCPSDAQGQG